MDRGAGELQSTESQRVRHDWRDCLKEGTGSREPGLLLNGCVPQAHASAALNFSFLMRWMNKEFGRTALKD